MTDELKPCPFCGCDHLREVDALIADDNGDHEELMIECMNCDAQAKAEFWNQREFEEDCSNE